MLREALDDPDPVLFLEHKKTYRLIEGPVPDGWRVPLGQADIARPGRDLSIITYGLHRHLAIEAADALAAETGAQIEVVDLRTINPLDRETIIESAIRCAKVLVVHEDNITYGVGAEVAAVIAQECFYDLDAPVRRLAMADVPAMPFAGPMEAAVSIDAARIKAEAKALLDT
jgi:2-oxoisovalerate dehydrogenase E1 component beta subunit